MTDNELGIELNEPLVSVEEYLAAGVHIAEQRSGGVFGCVQRFWNGDEVPALIERKRCVIRFAGDPECQIQLPVIVGRIIKSFDDLLKCRET